MQFIASLAVTNTDKTPKRYWKMQAGLIYHRSHRVFLPNFSSVFAFQFLLSRLQSVTRQKSDGDDTQSDAEMSPWIIKNSKRNSASSWQLFSLPYQLESLQRCVDSLSVNFGAVTLKLFWEYFNRWLKSPWKLENLSRNFHFILSSCSILDLAFCLLGEIESLFDSFLFCDKSWEKRKGRLKRLKYIK